MTEKLPHRIVASRLAALPHATVAALLAVSAHAATLPPAGTTLAAQSLRELGELSIEELSQIEVTSASRRPEPLSEATSARAEGQRRAALVMERAYAGSRGASNGLWGGAS